MRNCYLLSKSWFGFLDLCKFRDCNFFPKYTLLVIRFFGAGSSSDNLNLKKWGMDARSNDLSSEKWGTNIGSNIRPKIIWIKH